MNEHGKFEYQHPKAVKVYMTEKPRVGGLFHHGRAEAHGAAKRWKNRGGLIMHIGPCKCGDPTHKFPQYYSATPCLYLNLGGHFVSVRIPWMVFDAIQWVSGTPEV